MLRNREPYRYAIPASTQNKLAKLRVQATGTKRRGGTPKGAPRSANYGTGRSVRIVPSVHQVYAAEQFPAATPLDTLPPGERRHLIATKSLQHVQKIQQPQTKPRRSDSKEANRA